MNNELAEPLCIGFPQKQKRFTRYSINEEICLLVIRFTINMLPSLHFPFLGIGSRKG